MTEITATATATTVRYKRRSAGVLWTLQILLALFFGAASALPKLLALPAAVTIFDAIGLGDWFMYLVGLLELAGAAGLLVRRLTVPAALGLILLLVGAFITQLAVLHGQNAATPLVLTIPLAVIAWGRRPR